MTHKDKQKIKQEANVKRIMQVLDLSEEQYHNYLFDNAYKYLECREGYNAFDVIRGLVRSKIFWAWWKSQYANFDSKFLYEVDEFELQSESKNELLLNYIERQVCKNVYPGPSVMKLIVMEVQLEERKEYEAVKHQNAAL